MEQNTLLKQQSNPYRFERKFFVHNIDRAAVENIILHHPALFSEIYHERYVNNIYFDSLEFKNFIDNIDGNMYRTKYRIRWYGDIFTAVEKPVLELKIKKGLMGDKKSFPLVPFKVDIGLSASMLKDVIRNSNIDSKIKFNLQGQVPVILNRYKRKYFQSNDKKFRITVDDEQSYYKINKFNNTFLQRNKDSDNVIIEIKYDKKYDLEAGEIAGKFPFRITKSSKYARFVELLYF